MRRWKKLNPGRGSEGDKYASGCQLGTLAVNLALNGLFDLAGERSNQKFSIGGRDLQRASHSACGVDTVGKNLKRGYELGWNIGFSSQGMGDGFTERFVAVVHLGGPGAGGGKPNLPHRGNDAAGDAAIEREGQKPDGFGLGQTAGIARRPRGRLSENLTANDLHARLGGIGKQDDFICVDEYDGTGLGVDM